MAIDLRRLRQVVEVARSGSVTTAARSLAMSQPALTRSLAETESQLGTVLFERMPRGMRLTPAGTAFVERAQPLLKDFDGLLEGMHDYQSLRSGRLRVGIAPSAYQRFVGPALLDVIEAHPGLQVEVVTGAPATLAPSLIAGALDIMLGAAWLRSWPELTTETIAPLHCAFMLRRGHPLASLDRVSERDVLDYPAVIPPSVDPMQADITGLYRRNNLPPLQPHYAVDDFELAKDIVARTDAFSPVLNRTPSYGRLEQDFFLLKDVVRMPLQQLCWARARSLTPAAQALIEQLTLALSP